MDDFFLQIKKKLDLHPDWNLNIGAIMFCQIIKYKVMQKKAFVFCFCLSNKQTHQNAMAACIVRVEECPGIFHLFLFILLKHKSVLLSQAASKQKNINFKHNFGHKIKRL